MSLKHLYGVFIILVIFSSCTPYKNVPYFQDLKKDSVITETINNFSSITIQPGDRLRLHLTSLNSEADATFNFNLERPSSITSDPDLVVNGASNKTEANSVAGYVVDRSGYLHLPVVDSIKVSGYTIDQAVLIIQAKLSPILSKPIITLSFQNLRVSVLGDVARPDTYFFQNESVTLSEAIAYAGDLNATGIRNNILLIREVNGKRVYIPFDLTSKKIFNSPYYYLRNNDVIYVTPNRQKISSSDTAIQRISVIISALSLAIFLLKK